MIPGEFIVRLADGTELHLAVVDGALPVVLADGTELALTLTEA